MFSGSKAAITLKERGPRDLPRRQQKWPRMGKKDKYRLLGEDVPFWGRLRAAEQTRRPEFILSG